MLGPLRGRCAGTLPAPVLLAKCGDWLTGNSQRLHVLINAYRGHDAAEEGDLLEQKRTLQDGVFACMYTLVRQSALNSWQFTLIKVVLEGLVSRRARKAMKHRYSRG